jgi:uncharacterized protein YndB with AHSA1/START domain
MKSTASSYGTVIAPQTFRIERLLPGPIDRVWSYLTESEKRKKWLAAGPMELHLGGKVELEFHNSELSPKFEPTPEKYKPYEGACMTGKITAIDPPRKLSFTWGEESALDSEVTFELQPRGTEIMLTVTHRRLGTRDLLLSVAGGWHAHLDVLVDVLGGDEPLPFWSTHAKLEDDYERRIG